MLNIDRNIVVRLTLLYKALINLTMSKEIRGEVLLR